MIFAPWERPCLQNALSRMSLARGLLGIDLQSIGLWFGVGYEMGMFHNLYTFHAVRGDLNNI